MNEPVSLTFGDSLSYGHLRYACEVLRDGGLCLLPSDTCYSIAALPFRRDAIERLGRLIPGKEREPISLAFGSLPMLSRFVKLTAGDLHLIDCYCPGPLTLVCQIHDAHDKHIVGEMLHTVGNIGVRIPDSAVELQISNQLERPITTCAVRDDGGNPVRDFDDAVALVRTHMKDLDLQFTLFAVRSPRIKYRDTSTVLTVQPSEMPAHVRNVPAHSIYVFRPGVVDPDELEDTLRRVPPWEPSKSI